ncbi:hypothetical protein KAU09_02215 [Candidatus Parcubacteria bacterium]|nr:hypothetical protein [Candidatus Parcubacteria bacterium]
MLYNFKKKDKQLLFIILVVLLFCGLLIFTPLSFENIAKALTLGNYNRTASDNIIDVDDWNHLDNDFLLTDGANSMQGDLNMNNNRITNVTTTNNPNDAANVEYVTDAIAAAEVAGGGDIFVNWGNDDCPGGTDKLYGGIAFSAPYNTTSGGSNPVCMQSGDAGPAHINANADKIYPVVTGGIETLPDSSVDSGSTITSESIIKCALCHNPAGTCYEHYGGHDCGGSFSHVYRGYVLGSYATNGTDSHYNSTQRACVNRDFDSSISAGVNMGAMWYGARIEENFGLGYTTDAFIKCSICCN